MKARIVSLVACAFLFVSGGNALAAKQRPFVKNPDATATPTSQFDGH